MLGTLDRGLLLIEGQVGQGDLHCPFQRRGSAIPPAPSVGPAFLAWRPKGLDSACVSIATELSKEPRLLGMQRENHLEMDFPSLTLPLCPHFIFLYQMASSKIAGCPSFPPVGRWRKQLAALARDAGWRT